jgi:hypothetical protein
MTARKLEEYLLDGARVQRPQNTDCEIGAFEVNECADGINNDSDAFIDGADLGCRDGTSVREDPQCQEGINNDPTGCGLGSFELALILPGLMWLHRMRRRLH